ncbi:hypothetical protein ACKKBG_A16220 [Auxenochlorella protothecoides x Auxenochlorella symbiontica]
MIGSLRCSVVVQHRAVWSGLQSLGVRAPCLVTPTLLASTSRRCQSNDAAPAPSAVQAEHPTQQGRRSVAAAHQPTAQKEVIDLRPPRGTRDFPPEDKRLQAWLFDHFAAVTQSFGFEMVDYPVLESEALFIRKAGEEIVDQLYNFEDKGGRRVALRPELTPSLARLVLSAGAGRPLPLKWAAVGQCWRYERSTRGRRREHYQWNLDVVGVAGVEAEAELLAALVAFFRRVGLGPADVGIRVSTRALLGAVLEGAGVPAAAHPAIYVAVDRADKLPIAAVEAELGALRVPPAAIDALLRTLRIRDVGALSEVLPPDSPAARDLVVLFDLAAAYGIADWLHFDAGVVRGLAYYTGIVFEGFDRAGALRAVCGGGRYDRLLSSLGGADLPCAGFGFGDAVIVELLRDRGLLPDLGRRVDDVVHALEESLRPQACAAAAALRAKGRSVELVLEPKRMKWVLKHAERCGAARLVLLAPEEWARGEIKVKDLSSREERTVVGVEGLCQLD